MIDYVINNQQTFWFLLGFALLAIEGVVLGLTTGVVLFAGLGALMTGALMWAGLLPATWIIGVASFAVCSALITVALWKPLKSLQDDNDNHQDDSSDLIGHTFRLDSDISKTSPGKTRYSGIEWRVEVDEDSDLDAIASGERVAVSRVGAGVFRVTKAA